MLRTPQFQWLCDKLPAIATIPEPRSAMSGSGLTFFANSSWKNVPLPPATAGFLPPQQRCSSLLLSRNYPTTVTVPINCFVRKLFTASPPRFFGWGTTNIGDITFFSTTRYFARKQMLCLIIRVMLLNCSIIDHRHHGFSVTTGSPSPRVLRHHGPFGDPSPRVLRHHGCRVHTRTSVGLNLLNTCRNR